MSDHNVCIIPDDARFVPSDAAQAAAIELLRTEWPRARDIATDVSGVVEFRDSGENFETVRCRRCGGELSVEAWQDLMERDHSGTEGFRLEAYEMPCCGGRSTLDDLDYDWPQGFSRFALTAEGVGGRVPPGLVARLEATLGCRVRVIHQMY